jgi:hypothetical protein
MGEDTSTELIYSDYAYQTLTKEMPPNEAKQVVSRLETVAYSDNTEAMFEHGYGTSHLEQVQEGSNRVVTAYYVDLPNCNISILYSLFIYKKSQMKQPSDAHLDEMNENAKQLEQQLEAMTADEIRSTIETHDYYHLNLPENIQPS